jgi:hypothetical protein
MDYPNEKKEDYMRDEQFVYGMRCLNCGEVNQYVVNKKSSSAGKEYIIDASFFKAQKVNGYKGFEYKFCEFCSLYTKQELLTLTPPE